MRLFCLALFMVFLFACANPGEPEQEGSHPAETTAPGQKPKAEAAPAATELVLQMGMDVSGHSGAVNWQQVALDDLQFAFIKATEGMDLMDPAFQDHWQQLEQTSLVRGAYHFYVTEDDPAKQAQFFIDTVQLNPGDLVPVVDVEVLGHNTVAGWTEHFQVYLDLVEDHYGVKPIIYTSPNFWDEHFSGDYSAYPLWIAEYGVDQPRLPTSWDAWHLWQHQGDVALEGVAKSADLSRINPELQDLSDLLVPGQP